MGWKLPAASKRIVCASASQIVVPPFETVIIDMNAVCRRDFVWPTTSVTPESAVRTFWKRHVTPHENCRQFYFAFDSPNRIPVVRQSYLHNVRYANRVETEAGPFSATEMTSTWPDVWGSAKAKAAMWQLIARCLYAHIRQVAAPGVVYEIDTPSEGILRVPSGETQVEYSRFGEADLKAALFATERADGETLIKTIDWDMIVQGIAVMPATVVVEVGNVWTKNGQTYYSKRAAPPGAVRAPERFRPSDVTRSDRLSHAFLCLATAGVDYCDGLKRFGYRERDMMAALAVPGEAFVHRHGNVFTLDINALKRRLAPIRPFRPRSTDIDELRAEFARMWFCLLYFAFAGRFNERGGPMLTPQEQFFPHATTAQGALSDAVSCADITYTDDATGV